MGYSKVLQFIQPFHLPLGNESEIQWPFHNASWNHLSDVNSDLRATGIFPLYIFLSLHPQPDLNCMWALAISFRGSFYYAASCALHQRKTWLTMQANEWFTVSVIKKITMAAGYLLTGVWLCMGVKAMPSVCFYGWPKVLFWSGEIYSVFLRHLCFPLLFSG